MLDSHDMPAPIVKYVAWGPLTVHQVFRYSRFASSQAGGFEIVEGSVFASRGMPK